MTTNSDMPAMPLTGDAYTDINGNALCEGSIQDGMGLTKREHFAGLAMQSLINIDTEFRATPDVKAELAVSMADALLRELEE
mgnify:CR=1 FL=1